MLALLLMPREAVSEERLVIESPFASYVYASTQIVIPKPDLTSIILSTAKSYHIDPALFLRVARCESGLKPMAKNTESTASGIFQFLDSTFSSQLAKYGMTGEKNDPLVQIELAAKMIADGGLSHWNASKSCWNTL